MIPTSSMPAYGWNWCTDMIIRAPGVAALMCVLVGCAHAPPSTCAQPRPSPVSLTVGQTVHRVVDSQNERNRTGVLIDSGGRYRFLASGRWRDGGLDSTTAGGFALRDVPIWTRPIMWAAQPIRRAPRASWFALVAELSTEPREFFVIGDSLPRWVADRSGELVVFANDVKHFEHNNQGCISLRVERLR